MWFKRGAKWIGPNGARKFSADCKMPVAQLVTRAMTARDQEVVPFAESDRASDTVAASFLASRALAKFAARASTGWPAADGPGVAQSN